MFQLLQCDDCRFFSHCSVLIAVAQCGKKAIEPAGNDGVLAILLLLGFSAAIIVFYYFQL